MKMFLVLLVVLIIGIIIGICWSRYVIDAIKFGELIVDSTSPEKDLLSFNMTKPIASIINMHYVTLKVIVKK